ncbi:MAG: hydrogenase maturation protease [Acidobacteria bacterium]|nr:hydrogenase maturation protease [Acidobacteriota bacterium]MCA1636745.1 hydrogenase maturation protease [Acidobacteriota bacterium]
MKILIVGVGNVLRGDDGFGVAVAQTLSQNKNFSEDVDIFEAGIAGIAFVQELMNGYDALIIADAVERNSAPGTIFVFEPEIPDDDPTSAEFHRSLADAHYTEPSKVFVLARALKVLPPQVFVIGCQPLGYDELGAELSEPVKRAVPLAVKRIESLVTELDQLAEAA